MSDKILDLEAKIKRLERDYKKLWLALAFYADPETYVAISFLPDRPCGNFMDDFSRVKDDPIRPGAVRPGKRARKVLDEMQRRMEKE